MFGYQVPGRFLGKKNNHSSSSVYSDVRIITNKYTNNASMIIVRITVAATAGSILKYDSIIGMAAPKVPAKIRLKSIANAIINPNK